MWPVLWKRLRSRYGKQAGVLKGHGDKVPSVLGADGLGRAVRRNAIAAYVVKGLSMLVGLATVPAYMRYFHSDATLGVWYTIQTVLQWVLLFDLGIGNGLRNRLIPALESGNGDLISAYVSSSYRLLGAICLVFGVVIAALGRFLPWGAILNISSDIVSMSALSICITIVGCGVALQMFLQIVNGLLYALQLSSVVSVLTLISNTLILAFVLCAPDLGDSVNLCMLGTANVVCMVAPLFVATAVLLLGRTLGARVRFRDFSWKCAKETLSTGVIILFLQITWAVVAMTHAFLISTFRSPSEVVEYQIYYKVYLTLGSLAAVSLVPIWSAVTKAQTEGRFGWIASAYKKSLLLGVFVAIVCAVSFPFVQFGFDLWLGDESIDINYWYVAVMSLFAVIYVLQNANASIGNGLSFFRVQIVCMGLAALAMVPLSWLLCSLTESWVGVVLATIVLIMPFQVAEPIACFRYLHLEEKRLCTK